MSDKWMKECERRDIQVKQLQAELAEMETNALDSWKTIEEHYATIEQQAAEIAQLKSESGFGTKLAEDRAKIAHQAEQIDELKERHAQRLEAQLKVNQRLKEELKQYKPEIPDASRGISIFPAQPQGDSDET